MVLKLNMLGSFVLISSLGIYYIYAALHTCMHACIQIQMASKLNHSVTIVLEATEQ